MNKVFVILEVPAISQKYEIIVPKHLLIKDAIKMLASGVKKISNFEYNSSCGEILCHKESEAILDINYTVADYNFQNGDHLILL